MPEVNIVVGLSGVGKSTVVEEAMLLSDTDYRVINYGDRMLETAKEQDLVDSRDEMKQLPQEEYRQIQMEAAESIVQDAEETDVLVDTHAAIKTPYGYVPGLPKWTIEQLDPEKIIVIDASARQIFKRSQGDDSREREHDSVEEVELYRDIAREMAATGAVMTGAYLQVVENSPGKAQKAAEKVVETLRN
ncbi:MAG: adenylate kinase [Candidatus Nanohaloarchaea archaeon]